MTVPSDATIQAMVAQVNSLGFTSGTAGQNLAAMSVAWELVEYGIGTNLLTGTSCEEHYWPTGWVDWNQPFRIVQLKKTRTRSITSVSINSERGDCACGVEEMAGCGVVYNGERSEISLTDCVTPGAVYQCADRHPFKVSICYVAGLYNAVAEMDDTVITALGLLFSWWLGLLQSGGGDAGSGVVDSWHSMDYGESYKFIEKTVIGTSPQAAAAWLLLRRFRIKRAVVIRSYYPHELASR